MMERMLTVLAALEGGGAVSSKVCYHVALSGAGGKWGMAGGAGVFAGYEIGKKNGDVGVEGACGEEAGGELNSSLKLQNEGALMQSEHGGVLTRHSPE